MKKVYAAWLSVLITIALIGIINIWVDNNIYATEGIKNGLKMGFMSVLSLTLQLWGLQKLKQARDSIYGREVLTRHFGKDPSLWPRTEIDMNVIGIAVILNFIGCGMSIYTLLKEKDDKYIVTGE